jgi:hypothetical protein
VNAEGVVQLIRTHSNLNFAAKIVKISYEATTEVGFDGVLVHPYTIEMVNQIVRS